MGEWMIYGANGYTGRLLVAEAVRRGLHPILGGRNAAELGELARSNGLAARSFDLANHDTASSALSGIPLVLNCAGPFSRTAAPMLEACLRAGAHYLDLTGEIDVFAHCHAQHARARERGIVVLPGSGFVVVPTDCLAAMLARELPNANALVLGFEAGGGASPGTAKTGVEGLAAGGRVREAGKLKEVPLAWKDRTFLRGGERRTAMTIPWGDVYTAWVSTGIPNIEVYMAVPPSTIRQMRRLRNLQGVLGWAPVQRLLQHLVGRRVHGPDDALRAQTGAHVWGEVAHASGKTAALQLATPNGYELTVTAALGIVAHVLAQGPAGGYYTPSQLMGADYVLGLPGVRLLRA